MNFDKPSSRTFRGKATKDATREELLAKVTADRASREAIRRQLKAAIAIQRIYRGWRARCLIRRNCIRSWLNRYSAAAADVSCHLPAVEVTDSVLPPILQAFSQQLSLDPPSREWQLGAALKATSGALALRGAMALMLRSIASPKQELNLCSLWLNHAYRSQWHRQSCKLVVLCCSVLRNPPAGSPTTAASHVNDGKATSPPAKGSPSQSSSGQAHQLLQTAAARLLMVLTDSSLWKCFQPGDLNAAQACSQLLAATSPSPVISLALRCLVTPTDPSNSSIDPSSTPPQDHQGPMPAHVQAPLSGNEQTQTPEQALIIQMTTHAALRPLTAHVPGSRASISGIHVGTMAHIETNSQSEAEARQLCGSIDGTGSGVLRGVTRTDLKGTCLGGIRLDGALDALLALGNLAGLLAGERISKAAQGAKTLHYLRKSPLLAAPGVAKHFLETATSLLMFAVTSQGSSPPSAGISAALIGAKEGLWPLGEGTFIKQLLESCGSSDTAVAAVASFYHLLLEALPVLAGAGEQGNATVSALAFGCRILQQLWRWCAMTMGLPLEAPKEATRGWDIPTLRAGLQGIALDHAPKLGLFCRVYAHALLVLDDTDFYERQDTFTLSQQRGIATALNALVFRTYCPTVPGVLAKESKAAGAALSIIPPTKMLAEWAPILLRGLYERNVRRQYCPSSLWLEPFLATEATQEGHFSAGAVVRALNQGPTTLVTSLSLGRGPGGWPGAHAGLLGTAPQCIPFEQRLLVFRALVAADKERGRWDKPPSEGGPAPLKFTVHRSSLLQGGWAALHKAGPAVKSRLMVSFVNEQGMLEAGLDYGGLVKEFLEQAISTGFDANYGLFTSTSDGLAYPQPAATKIPNGLGLLEFLGLVVGKALYEGILLDLPLAPFFVARLQGRRPMFDELSALDPEVYRSLVQLKGYEGDATDLCLDFSIEDDTFGARTVHSLLPGGAHMAVTNANKLHYIHLAADWHLNGRLGASSAAFARGLAQVIPSEWLKLFNTQEVNQLLGGGESAALDVTDMAAHAQYSGGYSQTHPTIKIFWKVLAGLSDKEQKAFMRFVTSCSRAPLGGFQYLNPPLTVHKVPCEASLLALVGGKDVDRLPSASTCYNMLKLPNYRRATTLKEKLLYAVTSNAGFELS
ncbi:hypothetical protein WJX79_007793 [Trebouxia sp. C0005]